MAEVAANLEVTSLTQHSLAFERVVGAALDTRAGGHWAACAITWLKDGFPVAGHTDALRRIITEKKRVDQRSRPAAARLLAAPGTVPSPLRIDALSVKQTLPVAAANGSNHIALRCPQPTDPDLVTSHNDRYWGLSS
jgi:hypothetical protein